MRTIAIPQLYCGASGKKGAYNRQEVGLARAFAALGCRAVVLYPDPDAAPEAVTSEDLEPNVRIYYVPARKAGVSAFYRTWQPLLNEHVDAVHVMGDNALGVPGLYRFCRDHDIFFYSQLGAIKSTSENPVMRAVMDLLCRRNLAIYRKTPTYAKTPAVAAQLEQLHVPCAGVMPVGLDTAIIPNANGEKHELREFLKLDPKANYLVFVGRLDSYKRSLDLVPVLEALPRSWNAVVIGQGSLTGELQDALRTVPGITFGAGEGGTAIRWRAMRTYQSVDCVVSSNLRMGAGNPTEDHWSGPNHSPSSARAIIPLACINRG